MQSILYSPSLPKSVQMELLPLAFYLNSCNTTQKLELICKNPAQHSYIVKFK